MKKHLFTFISFIACLSCGLSADEDQQKPSSLSEKRIVWECTTGDAKRIAKWSTDQVRMIIDNSKLNTENLAQKLDDPHLERMCRMAHYFGVLAEGSGRSIPELKDLAFTEWLLAQPDIFEQLVFSGRASREGLTLLHLLWQTEGEKLTGTVLNLALGASIIADRVPLETCLAKYRHYLEAHAQKRLYPQFESLEPWEMAILMGGNEDVDDLQWGLDYIDAKKVPVGKAARTFCSWIPYRMTNRNGVSVHKGMAFYDNKPLTLAVYVEYGGVCGAVSKAVCRFMRAKGVPGYAIGQPGHCAFVYKTVNGSWSIGNDISGWQWSNANAAPWKGPTAIINTVARYRSSGKANQSGLCFQLAELTRNPASRELLLRTALEIEPANMPAWQAWLPLKTTKADEKATLSLLLQVRKSFCEAPCALEHVLSFLPLNWSKNNKYQLCSYLLTDKETKTSIDVYMRRFVKIAKEELPDLKTPAMVYYSNNKDGGLRKWREYYQNKRTNAKTREKTLHVIEQALDHILQHEQTSARFLTLYGDLLALWNDTKLNEKALAYVQAKLEETPCPGADKLLKALQSRLSPQKH